MMESSDLRVAVYWNLHKDCWSVQSRSGENYGKIIMHSPSLVLSNAEFVVRQAGRNKVLQERKKNVHAFVVGVFVDNLIPASGHVVRGNDTAWYDPYKTDKFLNKDGEPLHKADVVFFHPDRKVTLTIKV